MKISLITVCYNSAATIRMAIESVLTQTYPRIEYIVVDGGSKDGTVEILRKVAEERGFRVQGSGGEVSEQKSEVGGQKSDFGVAETAETTLNQGIPLNPEPCDLTPKHPVGMRWISEPDEGMYDAINKGIRMATGDVIGILNADDFLADDRVIERIVEIFLTTKNAKSAKIDVVYGDVRFVRECKMKQCENAQMRECANEIVDDCAGQKIRQLGNQAIRQFSCELASLRQATTLRYYSAKRWKPWMLQWGYMPPHPGVYIRRECFERLGLYKLGYHIAADYELLIRYLRRGGLSMRYLELCIVSMRLGGKSTKNWRSNLLLNQEIVRGNRENGYVCCLLMLMPKYMFKVFEFIVPWLKGVLRVKR